MAVLIPCAGRSSRYPGMRPKFLLTLPDGKAMFEAAAKEHVKSDVLHFAFLQEHVEEYDLENVMKRSDIASADGNMFVLSEVTSGPAETVYRMLNHGLESGTIKKDEPILIKDCDSFAKTDLDFDQQTEGNYVVVADLKKFPEITNVAAKSFAVLNENNLITNIVEKDVVSNYICTGMYGFASAEKYVSAYMSLKEKANDGEEIFISHVIKELLQDEPFEAVQAKDFVDCGTYDDYVKVQEQYATYFIDLDGTIWFNQSKLFENHYATPKTPIPAAVEYFLDKVNRGAKLIFTTARPESERVGVENMLFNQLGFPRTRVIMGLPHGPRVLVNDFSKSNPGPSAIAINATRDSNAFWKGLK